MKDDVDCINSKMLKNNSVEVKEAANRMVERIQDMELKMTILKNASNSFGAEILAQTQPLRPAEKKDNKRVATSLLFSGEKEEKD